MQFPILRFAAASILLMGIFPDHLAAQSPSSLTPTPLILEKNDGEHRVRKPRDTPMATGSFIMIIYSKNGSQKCGWHRRVPPGD
jgi:hypothetical protein